MSQTLSLEQQATTRTGAINALAAYAMWGFAPMYFKLLMDIGSDEIFIHRIFWSSIFLLVLVFVMKKWQAVVALCLQPRLLARLAASASILAINWLLFIWAVNNDHLLDASLGYFINPLFNVALGMLFFSERLRKNQIIAVFLAVTGVLLQVFSLGSIPVISLVLASTFAIYGVLRKKMQVDSFVGLLVESLLMLAFAVGYWYFFVESPTVNLMENSYSLNIMLALAGIVTTAPLLCFTAAAKRLTLSSLGFFQYIGPSIMFVLAVFYYQEAMQTAEFITFIFIWSALALYSMDSFYYMRKGKRTLG